MMLKKLVNHGNSKAIVIDKAIFVVDSRGITIQSVKTAEQKG
jgi:hypothetical protein